MSHLTRHDYASALALLAELERAAGQAALLDQACARLPAFIACETVELGPFDAARQERGVLCAPLGSTRGGERIAIVLRRRAAAFSPRERERLALLSPHLGFLCAQCGETVQGSGAPPQPAAPARAADGQRLTRRECDVMRWLAFGKTDADIAALLSISRRTVHKHLEHIYQKLGVETRTAAVRIWSQGARAGS